MKLVLNRGVSNIRFYTMMVGRGVCVCVLQLGNSPLWETAYDLEVHFPIGLG